MPLTLWENYESDKGFHKPVPTRSDHFFFFFFFFFALFSREEISWFCALLTHLKVVRAYGDVVE